MRICLIAEGCYPYVAGGVSSWVQMLIQGMPEHTFVIYTIAANESDRGKFKYELPENVERVEENFLDQYMDTKVRRPRRYDLKPQERRALLDLITSSKPDWDTLFAMFSGAGSYQANEFLASDAFLDVLMAASEDTFRMTPFNNVFWTVRSMLLPVLNILRCPVPDVDVFHAVSTGYAGLLGALFQESSQLHGSCDAAWSCGLVQFVRAYNRESEQKLDLSNLLNYAETWKGGKKHV